MATICNQARPATRRYILAPLTVLVAVVFSLPILWMLVGSLRDPSEILSSLSPLGWDALVPSEIRFDAYVNLWHSGFLRAVLTSLIVAVGTVIVGLIICSLAAFALSAIPFRGRTGIFAIIVLSFMIPFDAVAIPLFRVFRAVDLHNTLFALILPGIGNGLAIFLLRQFFLGIPKQLVEAARIDGASLFKIFWYIYLPLSRPALISAGIILFMFQWQAYLWPLIIISDPALRVGPVALAQFSNQFDFDLSQLFAGAMVLSIIPALILLRFQRYFVGSLATSGIK
ncbi:MAG: carbohydrate ABC transporter permease [Cypionkella sp.]|jgi:ABC-type glycerol-3-phosphate transport system permease component|nr:carbohydrate ABC transporter permease [Cypionkella sp.]